MIKIAFLQLLPSECVEENMEKGIHYCKEARKLGADIALFPEMWSCGYHIPHDLKKLNELAIPTDGEFVTCYAELAKELDMAIGITFLERRKSRPRNTICLYDHYGKSAILEKRMMRVYCVQGMSLLLPSWIRQRENSKWVP